MGYFQLLTSCLLHSARISWLQCTFPLLCCTFHLLFRIFDVLFQYFSHTLFYFFPYFYSTFSVLVPFFPYFFSKLKYIFKKSKDYKWFFCWHVQFIENIFLLQFFLKKEIATAKELDLRPLGKVIIFRDKQTKPSYYI